MSKIDRVANHLIEKGSITGLEMVNKYRVLSYRDVIYTLRTKRGMDIVGEKVYNPKKPGEYHMRFVYHPPKRSKRHGKSA